MSFYKNVKGDVFSFESGASPEVILEEGLTPMTDVEIEEHLAPKPDTLESQGVVSHAQIIAALILAGILTESEGVGWITGTLPAAVESMIAALPAEQRTIARLRAIRPTSVVPTDPLVAALAMAQGKDEADLIDLFTVAASL